MSVTRRTAGKLLALPLLGALALLASMFTMTSTYSYAQDRDEKLNDELKGIVAEFDAIQFESTVSDATMPALDAVLRRASALQARFPNRAELLCWEGWILIAQSETVQDFSVFDRRKAAMAKLQAAVAIDSRVYSGAPYVSLGDLHFLGSQFPFPLTYGGEQEADAFYRKALEMNPTGLAPNAHYAYFLFATKKFADAMKHASIAAVAPPLQGRDRADQALRLEARRLMIGARERRDLQQSQVHAR